MNKTSGQNGEREISSFTISESIDYVINALNDGKYQDAYKTYLIHVLEHIRGSPVDESLKSYLEQKEKDVSENWHVGSYNSSAHEFYKGQFLLLREVRDPFFRKTAKGRKEELRQTGLLEAEAERRDKLPWNEQIHYCGVCKERMVESHGSNDEDERIDGFRCPRCDSELQITIPHETGKTPRWKRK